jgi:beta-lactamase regulating signal transducer with metallopeptidase domain
MNTLIPVTAWLQLLALLAVEVGLIALAVAVLRRWSPTAAWGRAFCHAGIIAVLAVTACELSGSARILGNWAASAVSFRKGDRPAARSDVSLSASGNDYPVTASSQPAIEGGLLPPGAGLEPFKNDAMHGVVPPGRMPGSTAGKMPAATPRDASWLCLVWALGAALVGARALLARGLFVIFQFRCRPATDPALVARTRVLARQLGIRRRVRVIESGRLTSPIAFGFICPSVGLPPDFAARFAASRQDSILAHELAHLAAQDTCWCLLADGATAVLWWHPGAWWLRRQLHLASEMAADEASLLVADGPRVLAECLVELGTRLATPSLLGQLRVSGFRSHLGRRVQRLVSLEGRAWAPPPRFGGAITRILGPVAMTAAVVLCTAWAAPQALTKGDNMKMMQLSWKRSLATFALLAAFNGPEAPVAVAQSDNAAAPPRAPSDAVTAPSESQAVQPPLPPKPPAPPVSPDEAFRQRYGLRAAPVAALAPTGSPAAVQAADAFRARYGLQAGAPAPVPAVQPSPVANPARGAKVDAKLREITLDEVKFDGLPLSEVLLYLNDQSFKRDPQKVGVNFLINPNSRPVMLIGGADPKTGLPLAASTEPFDVGGVVIKFNQPLRAVTMRDLLDAIVTVSDHPIEYSLEDYGVVFAAKPETLGDQPVSLARPATAPEPVPAPPFQSTFVPRLKKLSSPLVEEPEPPRKAHKPSAELLNVKPKTFNVDFGSSAPSKQVGLAAAGKAGDLWNGVAVPFNDHHTQTDLDFADGDPSPIEVEMINLGGCWNFRSTMGVESPMLDTYNYPTGNRGGNSRVILYNVPAGKYYVYIYGHGPDAPYYGDYTLSVGGRDYGRKQTSGKVAAGKYSKWVEGVQYVKFSNVKVGAEEDMEVFIQPGGQVTDGSGRTFSDAMICGLQLIPMK